MGSAGEKEKKKREKKEKDEIHIFFQKAVTRHFFLESATERKKRQYVRAYVRVFVCVCVCVCVCVYVSQNLKNKM